MIEYIFPKKIIDEKDRNRGYLLATVKRIVDAIALTSKALNKKFPELKVKISNDFYTLTTQELYDLYPNLSPKERELEITKEYGIVFLRNIGPTLSDGSLHDGRSPDYDDWSLNGDILLWYEPLGIAFELS